MWASVSTVGIGELGGELIAGWFRDNLEMVAVGEPVHHQLISPYRETGVVAEDPIDTVPGGWLHFDL